MRFAPAYADKTCIGVVAHGFALGDQRLCLLIGKTLIDDFEDLPFRHTGVFEPADLFAGEGGQSLDTAVNDVLHGGVGKADKFQRDGFTAENLDLIRIAPSPGFAHRSNRRETGRWRNRRW